jgi:pimeloyl-ACP methyl ester carboxylesterase
MTREHRNTSANLRGIGRLAIDATLGITDLVEALHHNISGQSGITPLRQDGRTGGLTGMVYNSIRGTTRIAGFGIDRALHVLAAPLSALNDRPEREHIQSAVNGVLGDHLAGTGNPLAITMQVRRHGETLDLSHQALSSVIPDASSRVLLLVHGLCMNDLQWSRARPDGTLHDHGQALQDGLGYTAVYLHYNTGLNIAGNGRTMADLVEDLVNAWPVEVERLDILAHSMGGLVARSAHHHAESMGYRWSGLARKIVFLGTPHHGAPLERSGHWFDLILGATPFAAPFAKIGKIRSAGITDLRHGGSAADGSGLPPLPDGVACYAIAGTSGPQDSPLRNKILGDGLVPVDSALGFHDDPLRELAFPSENRVIAHGANHMELLNDEAVYAAIEHMLSADDGKANA